MIGRDILANVLGRSWAMLMGLAFVPVYLSKLGPEAYGLIGFYATLQAVLIIADFGLSWTITRELAQARATDTDGQRAGDSIRTLEVAYWVISITIGCAVAIGGGHLAEYWFQASRLSSADLRQAVHLIGLVLVLQMPALYYQGALNGLDRQATANIMASVSATLRWGGAAMVVVMVAPTIQAFFLWQVIAAGLGTALTAWKVWQHAPHGFRKGRFDREILRKVWRFTTTVMASAFAGVLAMQADKLMLSKLVSLEQYGVYSLAVLITSVLNALVIPVQTAFFPRLSAAHALGDVKALRSLYNTAAQLLAILIVPAALTLMIFPLEVLRIWTGNEQLAQDAAPLVTLLAAGNLIYCLSGTANTLLIAAGRPMVSAVTLALIAVTVLPALAVLVPTFGVQAAGLLWVAACLFYISVVVPITHSRLLGGNFFQWLTWSVLAPTILGCAILLCFQWILLPNGPFWTTILSIGFSWLLCMCAIAAITPTVRHRISRSWSPLRSV